jgi:redox-sensing transcriptional repressor
MARPPKKEGKNVLNPVVLVRLMHYYHLLQDRAVNDGPEIISSAEIADTLGLDDTLVRKDLAAIGVRGRPRVGFETPAVMTAIRDTMGFNDTYNAVIIGSGRLGGAIAAYGGFSKYGLRVVALFDAETSRIGTIHSGHFVQSIDNLEQLVARHGVRLAVLTVPVEAAQSLADRVVQAGIRAIWNFAPTSINVPEGVVVRNEHISVGLAALAYNLKRQTIENDAPAE